MQTIKWQYIQQLSHCKQCNVTTIHINNSIISANKSCQYTLHVLENGAYPRHWHQRRVSAPKNWLPSCNQFWQISLFRVSVQAVNARNGRHSFCKYPQRSFPIQPFVFAIMTASTNVTITTDHADKAISPQLTAMLSNFPQRRPPSYSPMHNKSFFSRNT